ncbi:MAG TPA: ABC transporter ATP-binding protein [Verrucomicrobiae bacterium]|nr:ABC transporter ATP-binding protein [Verrucomicrobiae bacterium]
MTKAAISISHLLIARSKDFNLSIDQLTINHGGIVCVVGPNGSGKTTLIECAVGLLSPQKGSLLLEGQAITHNLKPLKTKLGYIPDDEAWFIKELTAREYFEVLVHIYREAGVRADMQRNSARLAEQLNFTQFETPLEHLSHGNKKKVQIIAGLMHEPPVIIIDELRNGLDPLAIIAAEKIITERAQAGAAILAATHDLWWAERMAQQIAILINGRLQLFDTVKNVVKQHGSLEAMFIKMTNTSSQ